MWLDPELKFVAGSGTKICATIRHNLTGLEGHDVGYFSHKNNTVV